MNGFYVIAALGALALHSVVAGAAQRTFVASGGSDANPCSITQPCRGFAAAMTLTDANGEIIVLDSAGYGMVTVDKSVAIIAPPGVYAGISVFGINSGVTITAGATDKVVLRGLTINGQGGSKGIVINQAGRVDVQRCVVSNMASQGILNSGVAKVYIDEARIASNGDVGVYMSKGELFLTRSQIENNASSGLFLAPAPDSTVHAVVRHSVFSGNTVSGVQVFVNDDEAVVNLTVEDTASVHNIIHGFTAVTLAGAVTFVLTRSMASRNGGVGFDVNGSNITASVSGSTLARNYTFDMRQAANATLRSHGNNALSGDGPGNVSGTITQVGLN